MNEIQVNKLKRFARGVFNTSIAAVIISGIVILVMLWGMSFRYVKPYEYGVKEIKLGFNTGVQKKVYSGGLFFVMPFGIEIMNILPKNIQQLDFSINSKKGSQFNVTTLPSALIQTSDGFQVRVDATILYRIVDPIKTLTILGRGNLYETQGIIPKAEPTLKKTLGTLTTEDFYNSPKRVEKMKLAKEKLNEELLPMGIQIEEVLIRYFQYSQEIQKNIEEKKLKDQLVYKNQAEARAAQEEAKLSKTIEEGVASINIKLEEGNAYVVNRNAERDLYVRKKRAEADLQIKLAEARRTSLKNDALKVKGSENLIGLKMAETLDGVNVIMLPTDGKNGINPLNLGKMIRMFE